ncbi:MAG: type I methionyl aminopeptidase [Pseudomonadota bacterium]
MIFFKSKEEILRMRESGRIVADVLKHLRGLIKPGISTLELETAAVNRMKEIAPDAVAAFKGYMGFPAALCVSLNSEVVHGIPSAKRFVKDGDIVSVDFGVEYHGYYGDAAISVIAGEGSQEAKRLVRVTEESLYEGIKAARVGNKLFDVSHAIQEYVESYGYSVVREYVGHGIGRSMHESPQVPNFGETGTGLILTDGMTIAIEPMISAGGYDVSVLNDGWTAVTSDGSLSAHFEHSIAITSQGTIILTEL